MDAPIAIPEMAVPDQPLQGTAVPRDEALRAALAGRLAEARHAFERIAASEPLAADAWVNLALAELALGQPERAVGHFERGVSLLEERGGDAKAAALSASLQGLAAACEAIGEVARASDLFARAHRAHPRSPRPLAALAHLLGRAGDLVGADLTALAYCRAAVSDLNEKAHIGAMRRFAASLRAAPSLDGGAILRAARDAYAARFDEVLATLPAGVRAEAELFGDDGAGGRSPLLPDADRPFARARVDAIDPATGERWMIDEHPTYAVPRGAEEAAFAQVPVAWNCGVPFPVCVSTRTAWDCLAIRLRFDGGRTPPVQQAVEAALGDFYARGFAGAFGDGRRGFFHFLSRPRPLGTDGVRYQADLGLSDLRAIAAVLDALARLHREQPIAAAVLGDAHLPLLAPVPGPAHARGGVG